MYRQANFQTSSNIITFDVTREEAHKDITFELTIGQYPMSVRVFLLERGDGYAHSNTTTTTTTSSPPQNLLNNHNNNNHSVSSSSILPQFGGNNTSGLFQNYNSSSGNFSNNNGNVNGNTNNNNTRSEAATKALAQFAAMNRGFSITAKDVSTSGAITTAINTSSIMFYANDTAEQRICDYRHQVRVRSKSDLTPTRGPGEVFATDPLVQLASANGKLYMAMHCVEPISNVSLICYLDPPRATVADAEDDFYSIWRVSSNYVVSPTNQAAVVQKLRVKQHLMDDHDALRDESTKMTPLHVIAQNAADPAFAKLLLSTGWKAFDPDLLDVKGETPLIKLLQRPSVHDPAGPWHNRTIALLDIFVKFAGASLGIQSEANGDTVTHLAVRHHAYGGKILPFLLSVGGGHATILSMRNNQGLTPQEELETNSSNVINNTTNKPKTSLLQGFLKSGKDEALKLLKQCDKELAQEPAQNRLKVRGLPLYQGKVYYHSNNNDEENNSEGTYSANRRTTTKRSRNDERHMHRIVDASSSKNNGDLIPESLKQPAPDLVVWDNEISKTERRYEEQEHDDEQREDGDEGDSISQDDDDDDEEQRHQKKTSNSSTGKGKNHHQPSYSFSMDDSSHFSTENPDGIRRPIVRAKLAKLMFNKYDTDNDGFISRNALLHAIHSYDSIGLPQEAVDSVVQSIGICSDGRVNFDEFALILLKLQARG